MKRRDWAARKRLLLADMVANRAGMISDSRRLALAIGAARQLLIRRSLPAAMSMGILLVVWKVFVAHSQRSRDRKFSVRGHAPRIQATLSAAARIALLLRVLGTTSRFYSVVKPEGAPSLLEHLKNLSRSASRSGRRSQVE